MAPPIAETDDRMAADYYMTFLEYYPNLSLVSILRPGPSTLFPSSFFFVRTSLSLSLSQDNPFCVSSRERLPSLDGDESPWKEASNDEHFALVWLNSSLILVRYYLHHGDSIVPFFPRPSNFDRNAESRSEKFNARYLYGKRFVRNDLY